MTAQVKRARIAFTDFPFPDFGCVALLLGGRAASVLRSLALRPRLATGLPWTISER
jgi:hypothetical protein